MYAEDQNTEQITPKELHVAEQKDDKARNSEPAQESSQTTPAPTMPEDQASTPVQTPAAPSRVGSSGAPGDAKKTELRGTSTPATSTPLTDQIVQAAIAQIETIALQNPSWYSLNSWKQYLDQIETVADTCVNGLLTTTLSQASDDTKKELIEVVKDRRSKLPLSTGITDQIVGICQSLLAFGAGGLALSLAFIDKASTLSVPVQKYLAIAGIFYVELVVVSILALILYMIQARFRYPSVYFKKIGNAWPWFYYASISPDVPRGPIQPSRQRLKATVLYAKDFIQFTRKVLNEGYPERLRNEIQQYFLLMSFQGYVNQFSLRLANFFMYGFTGAFISMLIMFVLVRFFRL